MLPLQASQQQQLLLQQQQHLPPAVLLELQQLRKQRMLQLHPSTSSHLASSFYCSGCVRQQLQEHSTGQHVSSTTLGDKEPSMQLSHMFTGMYAHETTWLCQMQSSGQQLANTF
jgi:hypothetical protein